MSGFWNREICTFTVQAFGRTQKVCGICCDLTDDERLKAIEDPRFAVDLLRRTLIGMHDAS